MAKTGSESLLESVKDSATDRLKHAGDVDAGQLHATAREAVVMALSVEGLVNALVDEVLDARPKSKSKKGE